jgi:hypothetical protein
MVMTLQTKTLEQITTKMEKGFKYWLSWISVLPISLISGVLIIFPVHWVLYQTLSGGDSPFIAPYPELPEKILQPFFTALVIVCNNATV